MNLLGKLDWNAIPFDQPIIMGASGGMVLVIVAVLSWVTLKGYVPYLWREWLTSVDHKRIGIMYLVVNFTFVTGDTSLTDPYQAVKGQRYRIDVTLPMSSVR